MKQAFSLVELSIVLVILGLLTGGILAGQSLIRASEVRSAITEFNRYYSATQTFRDKYQGIPGDIPNATRFWGDDNTNCADAAITNGSPGTCNGDGDGVIDNASAANAVGESYSYWQQMALAGLIEGSYSILAGSSGAHDHTPGVNCPMSKVTSSAWGMRYDASLSSDSYLFDGVYGHFLVIGRENDGNRPTIGTFKPEEMWNIDTKLDDGKPAIGKVVVRMRPNCTLTSAGAAITTAAADAAKLDAVYNLTSTSTDCSAAFRQLF